MHKRWHYVGANDKIKYLRWVEFPYQFAPFGHGINASNGNVVAGH
jgi:hypothetical protein